MNTATITEHMVYLLELNPDKTETGYFKYSDRKGNFTLQIQAAGTVLEPDLTVKLSDGEVFPFNSAKQGSNFNLWFTDSDEDHVIFKEFDLEERVNGGDVLGFVVGDPDTVTVTVVYDDPPMNGG